jgi:hypothetical protein
MNASLMLPTHGIYLSKKNQLSQACRLPSFLVEVHSCISSSASPPSLMRCLSGYGAVPSQRHQLFPVNEPFKAEAYQNAL